jgi:hypothetical protein
LYFSHVNLTFYAVLTGVYITAPPSYNSLTASPSYAECVFGKVDIKANKGDKHTTQSWAPAYTYYHWNQQSDHQGLKPTVVSPAASSYNDI